MRNNPHVANDGSVATMFWHCLSLARSGVVLSGDRCRELFTACTGYAMALVFDLFVHFKFFFSNSSCDKEVTHNKLPSRKLMVHFIRLHLCVRTLLRYFYNPTRSILLHFSRSLALVWYMTCSFRFVCGFGIFVVKCNYCCSLIVAATRNSCNGAENNWNGVEWKLSKNWIYKPFVWHPMRTSNLCKYSSYSDRG